MGKKWGGRLPGDAHPVNGVRADVPLGAQTHAGPFDRPSVVVAVVWSTGEVQDVPGVANAWTATAVLVHLASGHLQWFPAAVVRRG